MIDDLDIEALLEAPAKNESMNIARGTTTTVDAKTADRETRGNTRGRPLDPLPADADTRTTRLLANMIR